MSNNSPISLGNVPSPQYGLNKILEIINEKPKNNIPNAPKDPSNVILGNTLNYKDRQLNQLKDEGKVFEGKTKEIIVEGEKTPILKPNEFLERISSFLFHLPHQWLYVVHFNSIPPIIFKLTQETTLEINEPRSYFHNEFSFSDISQDNENGIIRKIIDSVINERGACWLALDMSLPGEKINLANGDFMSNEHRGGLMGGPTLKNREKFDELKLAFLETNASFGDLIIRPWIKLASHAGLIARSDDDPLNSKVDAWITFYSKNGPLSNLVPRKTYFFKDLVPISINSETKTNSGDGEVKAEARIVNFTYAYYTVKSELGNYI